MREEEEFEESRRGRMANGKEETNGIGPHDRSHASSQTQHGNLEMNRPPEDAGRRPIKPPARGDTAEAEAAAQHTKAGPDTSNGHLHSIRDAEKQKIDHEQEQEQEQKERARKGSLDEAGDAMVDAGEDTVMY